MQSPSLTCPYCGREIELSQALTHSIEEKLSRELEEERGKSAAAIETRKEQEYRLKDADRDRKFQDLQGQIEILKRQEDLLRKQATESEGRNKKRIVESAKQR